jgi:hypothetical protein
MSDINNLIGSYRSVFKSSDGEKVLEDLRDFSNLDAQAGSELSHAECAYRNGMQDMFRYIEAVISDD